MELVATSTEPYPDHFIHRAETLRYDPINSCDLDCFAWPSTSTTCAMSFQYDVTIEVRARRQLQGICSIHRARRVKNVWKSESKRKRIQRSLTAWASTSKRVASGCETLLRFDNDGSNFTFVVQTCRMSLDADRLVVLLRCQRVLFPHLGWARPPKKSDVKRTAVAADSFRAKTAGSSLRSDTPRKIPVTPGIMNRIFCAKCGSARANLRPLRSSHIWTSPAPVHHRSRVFHKPRLDVLLANLFAQHLSHPSQRLLPTRCSASRTRHSPQS